MNIDNLIKVNDENTKSKLLDYIGEDFKKVPYLYLDLEKYGLGNDNVETWYYDSNDIQCIFLRYFDCLHIYAKKMSKSIEELILNVIYKIVPHTIITIDKIGLYLKDKLLDKYKTILSFVLDETNVLTSGIGYKVELAERDDLVEIADLFLQSEHYKRLYNKEVLLKQFEQRYDDKFGRFFKVCDNGKIVGSLSTYGENDKFAIVSGMIVDLNYKKPGVAVSLGRYVSKVLRDENKINLGFVSEDNIKSMNLTLKQGGVKISDYYQFIKM